MKVLITFITGVDAYYRLSENKNATVDELVKA